MLRNPVLEMGYYNTYFFANVVNNVLLEPFAYLRGISDFFENDSHTMFFEAYPKYTALHKFSEYIIEMMFSEDLSSEQINQTLRSHDKKLPINQAMDFYKIEHMSLIEWLSNKKTMDQIDSDDLYHYYQDLRLHESFDKFISQTTDEVFFVMFLNRSSLYYLNDIISWYIREVDADYLLPEEKVLFDESGTLKRQYMPEWVRRAVHHRDRGMCAMCHRDLTGIVNISNVKNFDHIIPLAVGGINDITNIQLLCDGCNKRKGDRKIPISTEYDRWYSLE